MDRKATASSLPMWVVQVTGGLPEDTQELPTLPKVKGHCLEGGPQMIQLR